MSKFSMSNFIRGQFGRYELLKVSVDYCIFRGRYDEREIGRLRTLEVLVTDYCEYGSFFKAVKKLMNEQCDAPANSADCYIRLSPVYRLSFYLNDNCDDKDGQEHIFMEFSDKFYKYASRLGLDHPYDPQEGCDEKM